MEEAELIKRSQQGDLEAFRALVELYQKEVFKFAVHILGDIDDAEDICQNAWIDIWKSIKRYKGGSFRNWILRIVMNDCRDEFRRRKKRYKISLTNYQIPETADSTVDEVLCYEIGEAVQDALLQLPYNQRLVIIFREFNNLRYDEIAFIMKCSSGAVRSRLNRGRISLRNILCDRGFLE